MQIVVKLNTRHGLQLWRCPSDLTATALVAAIITWDHDTALTMTDQVVAPTGGHVDYQRRIFLASNREEPF